ncbi:2'-5' RNA ligase family protein [Cryobacterium sp. 1639]|uniref:2'-5' RNA ligase family protein n=1 Tax=Cryobacterium inferilacus TaxID=2866629 RepID=UPI001C734045|nr:2'-5' RNA ligase family protein [Cryobacterium sp. 1639]MBX0299267.1 2'-5' RNA ligase family protein [Cryobacterium sp. 1639]
MTADPGHDGIELRNHWWWRPGWQLGTRYYTWHLTFPAEPPFRRLVGSYQHTLSGFAQLDAVPMEWLHLTLVGVGDATAVTHAQVCRIADRVRREAAVLPPVALTFQRAVVLNEAVALVAEPNESLADLRRMLTAVVSESLPAAPAPAVAPRAFVPHVSVAYVNADSAGLHVSRAVDQTPTPAAVAVSPLLSLIELHRDNRQYEWRTIEDIPLG